MPFLSETTHSGGDPLGRCPKWKVMGLNGDWTSEYHNIEKVQPFYTSSLGRFCFMLKKNAVPIERLNLHSSLNDSAGSYLGLWG